MEWKLNNKLYEHIRRPEDRPQSKENQHKHQKIPGKILMLVFF